MSFETAESIGAADSVGVADLLAKGKLAPVATIALRHTSRRPAPATIWRWCRKGLRGGQVRLDCLFHGGQWMTTDAAFLAFIDAQTTAALGRLDDASSPDVDDALREQGLL